MTAHRYPKFNEHPMNIPTTLSAFGKTPLGELVWVAIPAIALILVWLLK